MTTGLLALLLGLFLVPLLALGNPDLRPERVSSYEIGYKGPLSVEWEDSGMDRKHGAKEACQFVRKWDFQRSNIAFDAQFDR